jgi:hypothetical protein
MIKYFSLQTWTAVKVHTASDNIFIHMIVYNYISSSLLQQTITDISLLYLVKYV